MPRIARPLASAALRRALAENPACALLGPRQCGKTTLALQLAGRRRDAHVFDLEVARDFDALADPILALDPLRGLVVIDEVQRRPELFAALRPLLDRRGTPARFLLLGSASPDIVRGVSETLAGRIGFVHMSGFDLRELGPDRARRLWLRGGFPRSFLARSEGESLRWRENFIQTFLERDMPSFGLNLPALALRRFWLMVANSHGSTWGGSDIASSLGVSEPTVRRYLDALTGGFMLRQLPPWFENITRRQVKSPKVYVRDCGLLHALLSIATEDDLRRQPVSGRSWEGFALEQVLAAAGQRDAWFWAAHSGPELDLLLLRGGNKYGVEFKRTDSPELTRSLATAMEELKLERAWIVYPGDRAYSLKDRVSALPLADVPRVFSSLAP
jgi:hypothetical protein